MLVAQLAEQESYIFKVKDSSPFMSTNRIVINNSGIGIPRVL